MAILLLIERNVIKAVSQKSLLNGVDATKLKAGGTAIHTYDTSISTVVQNYDTAYYQNVTDKMFLLDVKQVNKVYQNGTMLGTNYYIGQPTQKAVDKSEYKNGGLVIGNNWNYWLCSPYTTDGYSNSVRGVQSDGSVGYYIADCLSLYYLGVRPAFFLDLSSVIFKSGNGSVGTPFWLGDTAAIMQHDISNITSTNVDNTANITATITNNTSTVENPIIVYAIYNMDNNRLISINSGMLSFYGSEIKNIQKQIKLSSDIANYRVKLLVIKDLLTMQPMAIVNEISKHTGIEK